MTDADRRALLLGGLMTTFGAALAGEAAASPLDPAQTQLVLPADLKWTTPLGAPPKSFESVMLSGALDKPGLYFTLVRWWPGWMSGPHTYVTDRLCAVVSGAWWINSGADFDPAACVPAPAGSFIRRVAGTPHYDGVIVGAKEPAVIAIAGIAPVGAKFLDVGKPPIRKL
ncbi:hypothetical protein BH09PSE2_BH09PSE2_16230 [soil metagenome]